MELPTATNGNYEIDPNLGSPLDFVKSYCDFDSPDRPRTCVDNSTTDSQLMHLHLLHTQVVQSVHLPCSVLGPLRLNTHILFITLVCIVLEYVCT